MIFENKAENVNDAYWKGLQLINTHAVPRDSRAGSVLELPGPLITQYQRPWNRVLLDSNRDANPFFHLFEAIWMLSGSREVAFLAGVLPRMREFSDYGDIFHGAYGYRWRSMWSVDQLHVIAHMLDQDHTTRRAVLSMWHPELDLGSHSVDIPCNTQVYFKIRDGFLHTTVTCRSNDLLWGLYGSNAVHFSVLHEWISVASGYTMGPLTVLSDSAHIYIERWRKLKMPSVPNPYAFGPIEWRPIVDDPWQFLIECKMFVAHVTNVDYKEPFFTHTAGPMWDALKAHRNGRKSDARELASTILATDWRRACTEWLERRAL